MNTEFSREAVRHLSDPTSNGITTVISKPSYATSYYLGGRPPPPPQGGVRQSFMLSFIVVAALLYLLDIVCLSSSPWLIYLFIPLFFQWSVLTGCTYVLCSANCSHSEFECYCPLLITHLSLWLQQICKDSPDGKGMDLRPSSKAKERGTA